jgi:aspartate racemase
LKTLGLIGGISWFSTAIYYRTINELTNEMLGGSHSAKILMYSIDFDYYKTNQEAGNWEPIDIMLSCIAQKLEKAGVDCIVICSNTPHMVADSIRQKIKVPLLHIAEETAKAIVKQNIKKVGLIGTKFTMENSFYKDRLTGFEIEPIIPEKEDIDFIHSSIINELTHGVFKEATKKRYLEIIAKLQQQGAEGIIFGCTEFSLLIPKEDYTLPVFDTASIHAKAAVEFALS